MSFKLRDAWKGAVPVIREKHSEKFPVSVECGLESKVQHQFTDQCDINRIGGPVEGAVDPSLYRDLSDILDFGMNMEKAAKAQQLFEQAPVALRKRVGHTVEGLFRFIADQDNVEECIKFGLFEKPVVPSPVVEAPTPSSKKDGSFKKPLKVSEESSED